MLVDQEQYDYQQSLKLDAHDGPFSDKSLEDNDGQQMSALYAQPNLNLVDQEQHDHQQILTLDVHDGSFSEKSLEDIDGEQVSAIKNNDDSLEMKHVSENFSNDENDVESRSCSQKSCNSNDEVDIFE